MDQTFAERLVGGGSVLIACQHLGGIVAAHRLRVVVGAGFAGLAHRVAGLTQGHNVTQDRRGRVECRQPGRLGSRAANLREQPVARIVDGVEFARPGAEPEPVRCYRSVSCHKSPPTALWAVRSSTFGGAGR